MNSSLSSFVLPKCLLLFIRGFSFSLDDTILGYSPLDMSVACRGFLIVGCLLVLLTCDSLDIYVLLWFCPFSSVSECELCNFFCIPNQGITQSHNWRESCEYFSPSSSSPAVLHRAPYQLPSCCCSSCRSCLSKLFTLIAELWECKQTCSFTQWLLKTYLEGFKHVLKCSAKGRLLFRFHHFYPLPFDSSLVCIKHQ